MQTQVLLEPVTARTAAQHPDRRIAMAPFVQPGELGDERHYRARTGDFHHAVWQLAANPVLSLLTQAVTHLVADHVVSTMDPVELRPDILDEHAALARAIAAGHGDKAAALMGEHFQAQLDYYERHWPARLAELIEWR
jgi:DNA-binding GntR family transcriptional regulator